MSKYADTLYHLKRSKQSKDNRWIVKYHKDGETIREIKLIFNPKEYKARKDARPLYTTKRLIEILDNDKKNRKAE